MHSAEPAVVYLPEKTISSEADILFDIRSDNLPQTDEIAKVIDQINLDEMIDVDPVKVGQVETPDKPKQRVILNKIETDVPLLAIVIDDMGINQKRTQDMISLKAPLTSSFLTYGKNLEHLAYEASKAGHELMIHAPMEPKVPANLAPDTLKVEMEASEIEQIFTSMVKKFKDIKVSGINNHMGSRFTENQEKLAIIMHILKEKNMFFLDSKTTSASKGKVLALEEGINFAARDVFLDNKNEYAAIMEQLKYAEKIAEKKGFAVAICHPKSQTYAVLRDWLASRDDTKIRLVHMSEIVKAINKFE